MHPPPLIVCAVLLLTYFSGYLKIRRDSGNLGNNFILVPEYVATRASLRICYRPCFLLEERFAGNHFSITPWGMVSP